MENVSILLSVKPEWLAKILDGEKTIEIRKTMPKCRLPIDVYLYCCKSKKKLFFDKVSNKYMYGEDTPKDRFNSLNGNVVAKFTLNKTEKVELERIDYSTEDYGYRFNDEILIKSCLTEEQLENYLLSKDGIGYAWYIDNLQIFDTPKELKDFYIEDKAYNNCFGWIVDENEKRVPLKKAPQSWCYCIYNKNGFMLF